jgi:hypothetical protein
MSRQRALEERGVKYAICIPANDRLERDIAELLARPAAERHLTRRLFGAMVRQIAALPVATG